MSDVLLMAIIYFGQALAAAAGVFIGGLLLSGANQEPNGGAFIVVYVIISSATGWASLTIYRRILNPVMVKLTKETGRS